MPDIGIPELLIIAVLVLLLFGPGRAADIGASLGKGVREFRKPAHEDGAAPPAATARSDVAPAASRSCPACGAPAAPEGQTSCENCGRPLA